MFGICFFFFKQKTAYEMRISDWSSDVCSSDLVGRVVGIIVDRDQQILRTQRTDNLGVRARVRNHAHRAAQRSIAAIALRASRCQMRFRPMTSNGPAPGSLLSNAIV